MEEIKLKKEQLEKNISLLIIEFAKEINSNDLDVDIEISKAKQGTRCVMTNIKVSVAINV